MPPLLAPDAHLCCAVEDDYFSHLHVFVRLRRLPAIYNLRFTLGTALLTIMSFLALFMKAGEADRLSVRCLGAHALPGRACVACCTRVLPH